MTHIVEYLVFKLVLKGKENKEQKALEGISLSA